MSLLVAEYNLGADEKLSLGMKRMNFAAEAKDAEGVRRAMKETAAVLPDKPKYQRIARYNYARAMFKLDMFDECTAEVKSVMDEYYEVLGIGESAIFRKNPNKVAPLLPKSRDNRDDLKHLGDCCALLATSLNYMGRESGLLRINATKFYQLAEAIDSFFRVGQDRVYELLNRNDYEDARDLLERDLIPSVTNLKVVSWFIPIRSQYAEVLAYCGDFDAAEREMARLAPYEAALDDSGRRELQKRRQAIVTMRHTPPPPQWKPSLRMHQEPVRWAGPKIQRTGPCPCGSGKKFKKCHGR
jgi:hypothetical protein